MARSFSTSGTLVSHDRRSTKQTRTVLEATNANKKYVNSQPYRRSQFPIPTTTNRKVLSLCRPSHGSLWMILVLLVSTQVFILQLVSPNDTAGRSLIPFAFLNDTKATNTDLSDQTHHVLNIRRLDDPPLQAKLSFFDNSDLQNLILQKQRQQQQQRQEEHAAALSAYRKKWAWRHQSRGLGGRPMARIGKGGAATGPMAYYRRGRKYPPEKCDTLFSFNSIMNAPS